MDGPADLLVVEDAAGEPVDPGVQAEPQLAEAAGARGRGRASRGGNPPPRRPGPRRPCRRRTPGRSRPARGRRGRPGSRSGAGPGRCPRPGPVKISPEGMLRRPSELIQVRPATESVRSVPSPSIRTSETPVMNSTSPACRRPSVLPGRDRVVAVEEHRRGDVSLVVGQRHPGVGGVGGGRDTGSGPIASCWPARGAGPGPGRRSPAASGRPRASTGCRSRPRSGSGRRRPRPRGPRPARGGRAGPRSACSRKNSARPGQLEPDERVRPPEDDLAEARLDQRPGLQLRGDQDRLAGLDPQAVVDQQVAQRATRSSVIRPPPRSGRRRVRRIHLNPTPGNRRNRLTVAVERLENRRDRPGPDRPARPSTGMTPPARSHRSKDGTRMTLRLSDGRDRPRARRSRRSA